MSSSPTTTVAPMKDDSQRRPAGHPLRVGLLIDSLEQPAWVSRVVREIHESASARIVLVVFGTPSDKEASRAVMPIRERIRYAVYRAYETFDHYWFADGRPDPFVKGSIATLIQQASQLRLTVDAYASGELSPSALDRIREHRLDVALRFGFDGPHLGSLAVAAHG